MKYIMLRATLEQQDGFEGVLHKNLSISDRICDFLKAMWALRPEFSILFRACFQVTFVSLSESTFRWSGLLNLGYRQESIIKKNFSRKSLFAGFCCFLEALGTFFLVWFFVP